MIVKYMKTSPLWYSTVAVVAFTTPIRADDGPSPRSRVQSELGRALARMEAAYARVRGQGSYIVVDNVRPDPDPERHDLDFAFNDPHRMVIERYTRKDQNRKRVYCLGPRGAFELRADAPATRFSIGKLGDKEYIEAILDGTLTHYLVAPFTIYNGYSVPLSKLMSDPSFRLLGVSEVDERGKKCVKIEYDCDESVVKVGPGWVVVSPEEGWAIRSYECHLTNDKRPDFRRYGTVEYGGMIDGVPIPTRVEYRLKSARESGPLKGVYDVTHKYQFDKIAFESTPEIEFTLSYFGLPEAGTLGKDRSSGQAGMWFMGLGLMALVVALGARYGARILERSRAA